jgi:hypothetical protein
MSKLVTTLATITLTALLLPFGASAQQQTQATGAEGDVRAPSPRIMDPNRPGYFQVGVGPAVGLGLKSDRAMYNINVGYNHNLNERFTGKLMADFNLGAAEDTSRFISYTVGGDMYLNEIQQNYGIPYVSANVGFATARNNNDATEGGLVLGAGAGFKFAAQRMNLDVNLHYSLLTNELEGSLPSVLGLRAALNF